MMNQREFFQFCREYEGKFDRGYRAVEGAVRMNSNESLSHFLKKADICFRIKRKIGSELLDEGKTPKWYSPRIFCEIRIGNNCFDVIALTLSGAFIYEVADSESDESLKRKERSAVNLGFEFVVVMA